MFKFCFFPIKDEYDMTLANAMASFNWWGRAQSQQTLLRLTVLVYIFTLLNKFFTSDKNMEYHYHAAFLTQQTEVLVP